MASSGARAVHLARLAGPRCSSAPRRPRRQPRPASGSPYVIPDTATAALGILLAIILATAGQAAIHLTPPVNPG
jgi:hypothetical protein